MSATPLQPAPAEFQDCYDEVASCGRCGFCQPTCPIFRATGREGHVARGKLALFRNMIEGRSELTPEMKDAFSNCLLCRACTDTCFSSIPADKVVVSFRHAYADRFGRSFLQRRVFRDLLPRPRLMRTLVRAIWALRRTGLPDAARRLGLVGLLNPKLERALELRAGTPGPLLHSRLRKRQRLSQAVPDRQQPAAPGGRSAGVPAAGIPRAGYWMSCGYNYVLPEVGESTVRVLERLGMDVQPLDNCCCGLAAYSYGDLEAARRLARDNLRRLGDLERFDVIVSECGSCSGHLKEYGELLRDDAEWYEKAERLQQKVRSFSELVAATPEFARQVAAGHEELGVPQGAVGVRGVSDPRGTVVTYHEPCHLGRRYQGVVEQPRQILGSLPGVTFREAAEAASCCGSAGSYGVVHPETSAAIIDRKMGFIAATGASIIATECPTCMMQLSLGVARSGADTQVLNMSQLCDRALRVAADSVRD